MWQSIITFKTISRTLSAPAKTINGYDETGSHGERKGREGRPRVTSASEDTFIRVTILRNCSTNKSFTSSRHISTSTVQRRPCESGLQGRIAAKKLLLKDTNNKKKLAWANKHKQWTLNRWKSVLWYYESKILIFGSNSRVFVRCRAGEQMISACVVPTVKHGGGGVMVWGCFAGDTLCDIFRIQGTLNQHGYHSILQWYSIPSGLRLVR